MWKLEGYDAFDGESYSLGKYTKADGSTIDGLKPEYVTEAEARTDATKYLAELEKNQPAAHSGGQAMGGIQDRVYLVHPGGHRERIYS